MRKQAIVSQQAPIGSKPRRLITPRAAAELLLTSENNLAKQRCSGSGPAYLKVGGRILYDEDLLNAYIDQCVITPQQNRA